MIRRAEIKDASMLAEILIFAKRTAYRQIFNNDNVSLL
jgi:putative acetyltransferase